MRQFVGWRVVCGAATDTFTVRAALVDCVTLLRREGRPAATYRVERINGREQVKRIRIRSAKRPQPQGAD